MQKTETDAIGTISADNTASEIAAETIRSKLLATQNQLGIANSMVLLAFAYVVYINWSWIANPSINPAGFGVDIIKYFNIIIYTPINYFTEIYSALFEMIDKTVLGSFFPREFIDSGVIWGFAIYYFTLTIFQTLMSAFIEHFFNKRISQRLGVFIYYIPTLFFVLPAYFIGMFMAAGLYN